MGKNSLSSKLLIFISIAIMLVIEYYVVTEYWIDVLRSSGTIPLTNLSVGISYILLWVIWPILGGILFVAVTPRILAPVFLKLKKGFWPGFKNAYLITEGQYWTSKKFALRVIYIALLVTGLVSIFIQYASPGLFLSPAEFLRLTGGTTNPRFNLFFVASIAGILAPFAAGLWAVGWAFQDASLIHYKFPEQTSGDLYEVEPVHIKYESLLKGYSGLSSILFLIALSLYLIETGDVVSAILSFYVVMHITLMTLPALFIHSRLDSLWLRRNLPRARWFSKSDVEILEHESIEENNVEDLR